MMFWIYDYPSWIMMILFIIVFISVCWGGIFLTRATVHSWIHRERRSNEMVGFALSSFLVLYGLLLGLLAIATYQNYSIVTDIVDKEASAIGALYRDFGSYPHPSSDMLQNELRDYVRATIGDDWREQRKGVVPTEGTARMGAVFTTLSLFEPQTKREEILYAEGFRQLNHLVELRRSRLANVTTGLPSVLWWVVLFGSLMSIALIWLQDMEIHVHLILGGILASILGATIFLIAELDYPFRGEVSVGPESIALVYDSLMKPEATPTAPVASSTPPQTAPARSETTISPEAKAETQTPPLHAASRGKRRR